MHFIYCSGSLQTFYKPKRHLFCQAGAQSLILIDSTWLFSLSCQSYLRIPCEICSTSPLPVYVAFWSYVEKTVICQIEHQGRSRFVQKRDINRACIPIRMTQSVGGNTKIQHIAMAVLLAAQHSDKLYKAILGDCIACEEHNKKLCFFFLILKWTDLLCL